MATIPIVFEVSSGETLQSKSQMLGLLTERNVIKEVDVDKIRKSLSNFSEHISSIFKDIKNIGDFKLKEIQLAIEISVEGGVALIGNVKAGTKGTVNLTFSM